MPAALAVQVLVLGCPDDDDGDTGNDAATVATATDGEESSGTGEWVDCAALAGDACDAHERCADYPEFGGCVLDCEVLDEADCNAVPHCEWFGNLCDYEPLA